MEEQNVRVWTGFSWLRMGPAVGSCEHGNEFSGSIKSVEFLDQLRYCRFVRS
jgi:hypothetical protein